MSIVMIMKWEGVTPEQYEKMRQVVNWEGNPPEGGMFHVAAFDNSGIRVTDIWESPEQLNAFVEKRLMPGAAEVGVQGQPHVEVYPTHAIFVPVPELL